MNDALMRFILSGNRSLEEFAVLLARISLRVFFAISGGNKLFVASQHKLMHNRPSISDNGDRSWPGTAGLVFPSIHRRCIA
jgi:hypothetical protein